MKLYKDISMFVLLAMAGVSASSAQASDWGQGCGARYLPQDSYQDLRYAVPPQYYSPERAVSWSDDNWVNQARRVRDRMLPSDVNVQARYRNDPRVYGQQNFYDPYAGYEYARPTYQPQRAETRRYPSRYTQYAPQYPDDYRYRRPEVVRQARSDDRYGDEYAYARVEAYGRSPYNEQGYGQGLIKKQAVYSPDRVYTSSQTAIVGKPSSAPYRSGDSGAAARAGGASVVLPGSDSVYWGQGTGARFERTAVQDESVSNAYFSRHGESVNNTQKMSATPTQGKK